MTHQTFVKDEAKGKPGERLFVEPISGAEVRFQPSMWDGKALTRVKTKNAKVPHVSVYKWLGFNLEINRLGLPSFKSSRKVAKSVRVKRS